MNRDQLKKIITDAYEQGVTVGDAEKYAALFLGAMMDTGEQLKQADLDSRMRKTGLKAVKAAVYLTEAKRGEKKPSDPMLAAMVDQDELVTGEQERFDEAECDRDALERDYGIYKEAHIYFRGVSKGRFE